MGLNFLQPAVTGLLLSEPTERYYLRGIDSLYRWQDREPTVTVTLALAHPASRLLLLEMVDFAKAYQVRIDVCMTTIEPRPVDTFECVDAARIAHALGHSCEWQPATALAAGLAARAQLELHKLDGPDQLATIANYSDHYWAGQIDSLRAQIGGISATQLETARIEMERKTAQAAKLGLFQPGMIEFAGDRYLGVERLHYLMTRLDGLGLRRDSRVASDLYARLQVLTSPPGRLTRAHDIEAFVSVRSPYSYLALAQLVPLAQRQRIALRITPVLPMVQRGVPLPKSKRNYFLRDSSREARRLRVPFGRIRDPLRVAPDVLIDILRAPSVEQPQLALAFMRAAWAKGQSLEAQEAREAIAAAAGVKWSASRASIDLDSILADNHRRLAELGHHGVPMLISGDEVFWGQDRLAMLFGATQSQT